MQQAALASPSLPAARGLTQVAAAPDESTMHADAVATLAGAVAQELDLPPAERHEVSLAGMLHDVGKAEIPAELIVKAGPLTSEEMEVMKTHTVLGQKMLERTDRSLRRVALIVRSCHERWDGGGYPDGLAGEQIPLAARIVFCCDSYDAMTTDRPYRGAFRHERALSELRSCAGTQFDPRVVAAVLRVLARQAPADAAHRDLAVVRSR